MSAGISTRSRLLALAAAVAALASSCTTAEQPIAQANAATDRQCFLASQVNGFRAIDEDTVHVTVGVRRIYELDILGTCPEIDWSRQIALRSRASSSWICSGHDAELIVPSPSGADRCPVLGVRQLTPEEVEAVRSSR